MSSYEDKLNEIHSDLKLVVVRAKEIAEAKGLKFIITEAKRSLERQKKLVAEGKSKTLASRHITGHAVDLAPIGKDNGIDWMDYKGFYAIADCMREAATDLGISIRWGGCWKVITNQAITCEQISGEYKVECLKSHVKPFIDMPHFELPKSDYPA